jgi:hypothetical protein
MMANSNPHIDGYRNLQYQKLAIKLNLDIERQQVDERKKGGRRRQLRNEVSSSTGVFSELRCAKALVKLSEVTCRLHQPVYITNLCFLLISLVYGY